MGIQKKTYFKEILIGWMLVAIVLTVNYFTLLKDEYFQPEKYTVDVINRSLMGLNNANRCHEVIKFDRNGGNFWNAEITNYAGVTVMKAGGIIATVDVNAIRFEDIKKIDETYVGYLYIQLSQTIERKVKNVMDFLKDEEGTTFVLRKRIPMFVKYDGDTFRCNTHFIPILGSY